MTKNWSSLITFFLVRPQFAGNAGAAARALQNCGFKKMALVNPEFTKKHLDITKFAVKAKALVDKAPVYDTLKQGLKSYRYVIGTSRRHGNYRKNTLTLYDLPQFLEQLPQTGKVAILFGHESHGLDNDEMTLCHYMMEIPSHPQNESFNLSQAVLLTAYEIFRQNPNLPPPDETKYPNIAQLEGMHEHLKKALQEIQFIKNNNPDHMPRVLRNIFNRAQLSDLEVRVIRGIARQMLWIAKQKDLKPES